MNNVDKKALKLYHQDLSKLFTKLEKKIADDNIKRQKAIETACSEYASEDEINNAWGWGYITAPERDSLIQTLREMDGDKEDMSLIKYRTMLARDIRSIKSELESEDQ